MPLWIIASRYDPARPVIHDCVTSILDHHPDAQILVVDSDSPDTSYLGDLDCETWAARNTNYAPGAYQLGIEAYPDEDFYYLLHDSTLVHDNLDDLATRPFTCLRWFDSATTGWGWDQDGVGLDQWATDRGVIIPPRYQGILGPILMATREVIDAADLFRLLPTSAYEQCALERCWGIWLQQAGHNPADSSLQGEMHGFFDAYDNTRIEKLIGHNRA